MVHTRDAGSVWVRADMYPAVVMVSAEPQWLLFLVISQDGWSKGTPVWRELLSPITEQKLIARWDSLKNDLFKSEPKMLRLSS